MSVWRVKVDCYSRDKPRSKVPRCVTRTVIVEAVDADVAMQIAKEHAASKAPMGPLWIGFEAVECMNETLPLIVTSWHHNPRFIVLGKSC